MASLTANELEHGKKLIFRRWKRHLPSFGVLSYQAKHFLDQYHLRMH